MTSLGGLSDGVEAPAALRVRRGPLQRLLRDARALIGGSIVLVLVLAALFAPYVSPHDPLRQRVSNRLQPPSAEHYLGTDELGRDVLSRIIHGARVSLVVGSLAVALAILLGVLVGLISGYFGGQLDNLLMRIGDVFLALPGIILAIAFVAVFGVSRWNIVLALGVTSWVEFARVVRGQVLSLREKDYVIAALAGGAKSPRILWHHVLPNVVSSVIVMGTLSLASMILAEASLSFLGLGVPAPEPTWGGMLSTSRRFMQSATHLSLFPGAFIMITVLAVNLLGDALRDLLDPKLRQ